PATAATPGGPVALKELRPEQAGDPELAARFLREARLTGRLEHPGIVPVYELISGANGRPPYYTMRFVKGRTLTQTARAFHQRRAEGRADPVEYTPLLNAFLTLCNTLASPPAPRLIP